MQNYAQQPTNTVCPVCGDTVDQTIEPVVAPHTDELAGDAILRVGTCCAECRATVACDPGFYFTAAAENGVAVGG